MREAFETVAMYGATFVAFVAWASFLLRLAEVLQ